jgi:hypothetical protein
MQDGRVMTLASFAILVGLNGHANSVPSDRTGLIWYHKYCRTDRKADKNSCPPTLAPGSKLQNSISFAEAGFCGRLLNHEEAV